MSNDIVSINDQNFQSEIIDYKGFVLLDFWAKWCEPCKILIPHLEDLAKNNKRDKIKICKFNIDEGAETPSKYGIQSIPTLIIFQNGKEIARKIGIINNLQNWIDNKIR